jgi:hypothetical protein
MSQRFVVLSRRAPRRIKSAAPRSRCQALPSQSVKIEGASRRSAAPGSQNVGVAEYGDDARTQPRTAMAAIAAGNCRGARLTTSNRIRPASRSHGLNLRTPVSQQPGTTRQPGKCLAAFAQTVKRSLPRPSLAGRKLRYSSPELTAHTVAPLVAHARTTFPCAAMPAVPKTAANPSFNLTFSGWLRQPPNAS